MKERADDSGDSGSEGERTEVEVEEVQAAIHDLSVPMMDRAEVAVGLAETAAVIAEAAADRAETAAIECASLLAAIEGSPEEDVAVGTTEEVGEDEVEELVDDVEEVASKVCKACHVVTTQMDVNQCPMCGNPFTP